jgi:hypothetical protein
LESNKYFNYIKLNWVYLFLLKYFLILAT